jgi:hypothetical protein
LGWLQNGVLATRALVEKPFLFISPDTIDRSARPARDAKSCLRSWRQSADTVTSARGSKVIGGRIYDATICLNRALICQNIAIRTENDARVSDRARVHNFAAEPARQ